MDSLSVCQISRQSEYAFACYSNFCKRAKRRRRKKNETLAARISEMAGAISFKFGM